MYLSRNKVWNLDLQIDDEKMVFSLMPLKEVRKMFLIKMIFDYN